jgi:hypothetical protein
MEKATQNHSVKRRDMARVKSVSPDPMKSLDPSDRDSFVGALVDGRSLGRVRDTAPDTLSAEVLWVYAALKVAIMQQLKRGGG